MATTPEEARAAAEELGGPVVVKAQVLVGGRGKAGGIKLANTPEEADAHAAAILGMDIRGHVVRRLWIEKASDIAREYYLSVTFDRGEKKPLFMFTTQGGIDIEEVAETNPEALVRLHVDPLGGLPALAGAAARLRSRHRRPRRAEAGRRHRREALRRVRRLRRDALRGQPADRHAGRRGQGARLEVHGGRQRALPAPGRGRDARRRGGRSPRAPRAREGRHLREARRRDRHPRERCRARHGHARRHRPGRRPAGELLRPGRRRRRPGSRRRARGDHVGRPGRGDPLQHLRRDHALRRGGARDPGRARPDGHRGPDRRPARRDERRGGPAPARARRRPPNVYVEETMLSAAEKVVSLK